MTSDALERGAVSVTGGALHYLAAGDRAAPLVLCLHGFPDHPLSFEPLMRRLAEAGFRAVAPWMRGYAPSLRQGPYTADRLGLDVVALVRALSPGRRAYVVGHDWGAVATTVASMRAPELYAAQVLMAVPHPVAAVRNLVRAPAQVRRSWYMAFFQLPGVAERAVAWRDFALIDWLWQSWSPGVRMPARRALHECLAASMPAPLAPYRALCRSPHATRLLVREAAATLIRVPTLHLHGARDGCIGVDIGQGQERYFAAAFESRVMPDVGHFLHVEAPGHVADAVLAWLRANG